MKPEKVQVKLEIQDFETWEQGTQVEKTSIPICKAVKVLENSRPHSRELW